MSKKDKLSERQKNILHYVSKYMGDYSRPPTIREIGEAVTISSTSVVNYNLTKLVEKGLLERQAEVSRGLRLTEKALKFLGVMPKTISGLINIPMVGDIVASEPLEVGETGGMYDPIEVSASMLPDRVRSEDLFALRVNGDSMIDAMVSEGDIVVMKRQNEARNGDMVAVWLTPDDTTTLKYFYNEGDQVRLQPANPTMGPIYVSPDRVQVQGKVVMVMRQTA